MAQLCSNCNIAVLAVELRLSSQRKMPGKFGGAFVVASSPRCGLMHQALFPAGRFPVREMCDFGTSNVRCDASMFDVDLGQSL